MADFHDDKLTAKKLASEHLKTRVEWFNTYSVYSQMSIELPVTLQSTNAWFDRISQSENRQDLVFFDYSIASCVVAMGGLTDISRNNNAELYVVSNPEMYGQGIGTRVVSWLCNYGFASLGLHRIYLSTLETNSGARKLYQRLGFQDEGILREHVYHSGQYKDRYLLGLLRSEWNELKWKEEVSLQKASEDTSR